MPSARLSARSPHGVFHGRPPFDDDRLPVFPTVARHSPPPTRSSAARDAASRGRACALLVVPTGARHPGKRHGAFCHLQYILFNYSPGPGHFNSPVLKIGLWTNRLIRIFIFRCHFWTQTRSGPQVLFKNAIKIYRKNPTWFLDLFTDMQHKVLHQKPGVAHL